MASHKLFIFHLLSLIIFFHAACSNGKDPEKYIGFWLDPGDELAIPTEIKQKNGKLYIVMNVNGEQTELPAMFDREGKSILAKLPMPTGNLVDVKALYLSESKRLQMDIAGMSNELSKISEAVATQRKKKINEFYDPSFFVGKWIDIKTTNPDSIEISKQDDQYFLKTKLDSTEIRYNKRFFEWFYMGNPNTIRRLKNGNIEWSIGALRTEYRKL